MCSLNLFLLNPHAACREKRFNVPACLCEHGCLKGSCFPLCSASGMNLNSVCWNCFFCVAVIYTSLRYCQHDSFKSTNTLWSFPSSRWSSDGGFDRTIDLPLASLKRTLWLLHHIHLLLTPLCEFVWVCLCYTKPTVQCGCTPVIVWLVSLSPTQEGPAVNPKRKKERGKIEGEIKRR